MTSRNLTSSPYLPIFALLVLGAATAFVLAALGA